MFSTTGQKNLVPSTSHNPSSSIDNQHTSKEFMQHIRERESHSPEEHLFWICQGDSVCT
ncbi:Protein P [Clarias magur]|uniref:Protein P n=1 Tax=Clarias magur TaxID=1594786 RepID=A0A8J4UBL9_CLAMG|nr:Protein P [Clarias magur]